MNRLKDNPSKADELAHLREFVAALPADSYLASYFQGAEPFAAAAMANDMPAEPLEDVRRRVSDLHADETRAKASVKELTAQVDALRAERRKILTIADYIREQMREANKHASAAARELANLQTAAANIFVKAEQP